VIRRLGGISKKSKKYRKTGRKGGSKWRRLNGRRNKKRSSMLRAAKT